MLQDFYKIIEHRKSDKNEFVVVIELNKDHSVFEGHFPGNPVTPGVCMIQILKEITEEFAASTLLLERISNVKFTALINPFITPILHLKMEITTEGECVKIKNISTFEDGTIALKCNGTFVKK